MAREMKDSGIEWIGEIPAEWDVSKVKYYVECYDGKRVPVDASLRTKGVYPYWGAGSITDYVSDYLFDEELILLGEDGAPFFDDTRPVAFLINEKVWVNNHIHVLKPHKTVESRFLVYWLNNVDYKAYINGSILNKLTQANMNKIAFAVPCLLEQHRIADFLDRKCAEIDRVLEKTRASIEEYKKLKQSVITQAVTKGIRGEREMKDSGIEWIGEIPREWEISLLKYSIKWKSVKGYGQETILSLYRDYGVVIKDSRDDNHNVTSLDTDTYKFVEIGDFVINKMKAWQGSMAVSNYNGIISPAYHVCQIINPNVFKRYFHHLMRNQLYIPEYTRLSTGMRIGQWDLSFDDFRNLPFIIPPMDEQIEIADYIDRKCSEIDTLISKKEQLITELEAYKKSLIYEYVTGKKEVQ